MRFGLLADLAALPRVFLRKAMIKDCWQVILHGSVTMRIAIFVLAILAGSGAAEAAQIEVLSANPRHIEIAAWCWSGGSNCQQEASDLAQGYCHGENYPRRALYVRSGPVERSFLSERVKFVFRCNHRSTICEAGTC